MTTNPNQKEWQWYMTVAAIEQYMNICRMPGDLFDEDQNFRKALEQLGEFSLTARLADIPPTESGAEIYRAKITLRGKRYRIEFTVQPQPRNEGKLPQLLRVRLR
jgi:hypothetical protein